MNNVEDYIPPKRMPDALAAMGVVGWSLRACQNIAKAMKSRGMPVMRCNCIRPSDAYAFLQANPNWTPFGKGKR